MDKNIQWLSPKDKALKVNRTIDYNSILSILYKYWIGDKFNKYVQ